MIEAEIIIKKGTFIQLSNGIVEGDELQLEGKKKMDGRSFANGSSKFNGKILK